MPCQKFGFFHIVEHGTTKERIALAIQASRRLFILPVK
ncbi:2-oxoglutarate and iron-dependent oxygenase domain-containing protein [Mesorhizobium sp. AaZ16]